MGHQEVIPHLFEGEAVDETLGAMIFAFVDGDVLHQMRPELVAGGRVEAPAADAAYCGADVGGGSFR